MLMSRGQAVDIFVNHPAKFGNVIGFTKLTDLHDAWIRSMVFGDDDFTLQAHRG